MKKKGFTLIELLAVLVVLAIIALITIPIVLGIINRARTKSAEASIRGYADTLEKSYSQWLIDNPNGIFNDFDYSNIDYKGNIVTCEDINYSNGNIELDCCYVGNNENNYYSYKNNNLEHYDVCPSKKIYNVGDTFTLNGDSYHVIADSPTTQDYVVALKDNPLKATEIEAAGGTVVHTYGSTNEIGEIAYGSNSDYETSVVKPVVDAWSTSKFTNSELKIVEGYTARLINITELERLGYVYSDGKYPVNDNIPSWVYTDGTWLMDNYCCSSYVLCMDTNNSLTFVNVYVSNGGRKAVRPVINVYKSKIK